MLLEKVSVDELENYTGKWMNILFLKDGSAIKGVLLFDTKEDAIRSADENRNDILRQIKETGSEYITSSWHGRRYKFSDRLFFLQIPC